LVARNYSVFAAATDTHLVNVLSWADPWFQRTAPVLVALAAALMVAWAALAAAQKPAAVAKTDLPATTALHIEASPSSRPRSIRESQGRVGAVTLGTTLSAAHVALKEPLISVQEATSASARFEVVAPKAGLRLSGSRTKIDTIVITNVGAGRNYSTSQGIALGDPVRKVRKEYLWSHEVCGTQWWFDRAGKSLRFAIAGGRVSSITLTSRPQRALVECT
jgi:hypothetical protein